MRKGVNEIKYTYSQLVLADKKQMDPQYNLLHKNKLAHDYKHCIEHIIHTLLGMGLCISDQYKPNWCDIQSWSDIRVYNLEVLQCTLKDTSSLEHHQHLYIVSKVHMVRECMDYAEVLHILVLKLLKKKHLKINLLKNIVKQIWQRKGICLRGGIR